MKKLLIFLMLVFAMLKTSAQSDSAYTFIAPDSSSTMVHDTIYTTTIDQKFNYIFENLDTEYITQLYKGISKNHFCSTSP